MRLIGNIAKTPATLKQASGEIIDGEIQWTSYDCFVFQFGSKADNRDEYGTQQERRTFISPPLSVLPTLPARIVVSGVEYELKDIKTMKLTDGKTIGYRFLAVEA